MNTNLSSARNVPPRHDSVARLTVGFGLLAAGLMSCLFSSGCQQSEAPAATRQANSSTTTSQSVNASSATPANNSTTAQTNTSTFTNSAVARQSMTPRDTTFDTVKLNMAKGEPFRSDLITPKIERMSGSKVRIRGYILPPPQQTGLTRFVLVRDNMACCFGPGAAIYDSMIVDLKPGMSVDYKLQPVVVEGTFNVHEVRFPSGRCMSIYHLTADKAE